MSAKPFITPSQRLDKMVDYYLANVNSQDGPLEMEVKFGTKNVRKITRNQFDNVAKRFTSLGFGASSSQHMLRILTEYDDGNTGPRWSNVRTTISGLSAISNYCRTEQIAEIAAFEQKSNSSISGEIRNADFDDFNFRVSLNVEKTLDAGRGITKTLEEKWSELRKKFRLMNRITFRHKDYPLKVDLSIVKSSGVSSTFNDSGVVYAPETYEIEIEVDNAKVMLDGDNLGRKIRKIIKHVLSGLQSTNYPISLVEQNEIINEYQQILFPQGESRQRPSFVGPSSFTLQIENIMEMDPETQGTSTPNIRDYYTVTDKADGDRKMMFISSKGYIYLLDTNMNVQFTGAVTKQKGLGGTLIDGEHIQYDKNGSYINLYAAFDIYYISGKDQRQLAFYKVKTKEDKKNKTKLYRYNQLVDTLKKIEALSVVNGEPCPLRIQSKNFISGEADAIFDACQSVLQQVESSDYEYNTDGLIFTPSRLGVGADQPEQVLGAPKKIAWKRSFKWKPPEYNTIDFLVKLEKRTNGEELVGNIFKTGTNMTQQSQLIQYKTAILHVGFNEERDGYPDAFQDVINGKIPEQGNRGESNYVAKRFYPTNPYDRDAAVCNLMMSEGANGKSVLKTMEGDVIEDEMVVEFSYHPNEEIGWRWKPLRVRYDKTADTGGARYGNAYHVANSNWHSIHNPVTQDMLTTNVGIPKEISLNEDVYYNRASGAKSYTRGLRDYHNWLKSMLITKVTKPNQTLIDLAVGKGGDMNKWAAAKLGFVFGVDYSKDNIENRIDGACARYLNALKRGHRVSKSLFVHGDSSVNIRNNEGIFEEKGKNVVGSIFGSIVKEEVVGTAVQDVYEIGMNGFDICSIQFAIHYMFESPSKLHNFLRNVSETTKIGGFFIGTSYDGSKIFHMLKDKEKGESVTVQKSGEQIWQVTKQYENDEFVANSSSLGYAIDVYQETINKVFTEYLVNYDYLANVLRNYGFEPEQNLIRRTGFKEIYTSYLKTIKNDSRKNPMSDGEKQISFLNRVFIFKKVRNVDAERVSDNLIMGIIEEEEGDEAEGAQEVETEAENIEQSASTTKTVASNSTRKNRTTEPTNTTRKNV
jgi:hypothetical protein